MAIYYLANSDFITSRIVAIGAINCLVSAENKHFSIAYNSIPVELEFLVNINGQ